MAHFRFHAYIESLPAEACPEVVAELDGIRYRAKVTKANSRMFSAELLEPFSRSIYGEIPLFVVAMSSFRFVRDGQPTTEMLKMFHGKLERIHVETLRPLIMVETEVLDGPKVQSLNQAAKDLIAELAVREADLEQQTDGLTRALDRAREHQALNADARQAVAIAEFKRGELTDLLEQNRAVQSRIRAVFQARAGVNLEDAAEHFSAKPHKMDPSSKLPNSEKP